MSSLKNYLCIRVSDHNVCCTAMNVGGDSPDWKFILDRSSILLNFMAGEYCMLYRGCSVRFEGGLAYKISVGWNFPCGFLNRTRLSWSSDGCLVYPIKFPLDEILPPFISHDLPTRHDPHTWSWYVFKRMFSFLGYPPTKVTSNLTRWYLLETKNSTTADILGSGFRPITLFFFPDPKNFHCSWLFKFY